MHYKWFPVYSLHTVHYKIIRLYGLLAVYGYVQSQMKASCTPVPGLLNTHSTALLSPPSVTATSSDHPKVYKLNNLPVGHIKKEGASLPGQLGPQKRVKIVDEHIFVRGAHTAELGQKL